jgi:hypothetical protein
LPIADFRFGITLLITNAIGTDFKLAIGNQKSAMPLL